MRSGALYLSVSSGLLLISGYLIVILLGKILGPVNYGIYGVIISLMTTINIIQISGIPQTTSKFIASRKYNINEVLRCSFYIQIIMTAVLTAVLALTATSFALLLNDPALASYIRASALILPLYGIFSLYTGYYNGLHDFRKQAYMNIVYSLAKLVLVIGFVYLFHLYGAIAGFTLAPLVALAYGFRMPKKVKVEKSLYRILILFSLPLIGFAFLSTLLITMDLLFVKALVAHGEAAGLYTASQNIARIPYFALSAFAMMLLPVISQSIAKDGVVRTSEKIRTTLRYLLLLLIPGTVLISSTSTGLLELLYTASYVPGAEALSWLVIGLAFVTLFIALANILTAMDRPSLAMIYAGIGVMVTVAGCMVLIPRFDLVGGALATLAGGFTSMALSYHSVSLRFPRIIDWMSVVRIAFATGIMYLVCVFLPVPPIWLPVLYIGAGLGYGAVLLALREVSITEIKELKNQFIPARDVLQNHE